MQTRELTALPKTAGLPAATLMMPIDPADPKANRLTLASAWRDARGDAAPPQAIEQLLDSTSDRWNLDAEGLAIVSGPTDTKVLWLPWSPTATTSTEAVPPIALLLPLLDDEHPFAVVALQLGEWRVLMCNRRRFEPLELDAPKNIDEATAVVQEPVPGGSSHAHRTSANRTTGTTRVQPQGFGHEDRRDNDADLYFRALDDALANALGGSIPVVLVGSGRWVHRFAEQSSLHPIAVVDHNPSDLDDDALHALGWTQAKRHIQPDPHALAEKVGNAAERCSTDRSSIVEMAEAGGIDTLVVPSADATDPDVNRAVLHTLEHGGTAHVVDDDAPFDAVTAAFRWSN